MTHVIREQISLPRASASCMKHHMYDSVFSLAKWHAAIGNDLYSSSIPVTIIKAPDDLHKRSHVISGLQINRDYVNTDLETQYVQSKLST